MALTDMEASGTREFGLRRDRSRCLSFVNANKLLLGDNAYDYLRGVVDVYNPSLVMLVAICILDQGVQERSTIYYQRMIEEQRERIAGNFVAG